MSSKKKNQCAIFMMK